MAGLAETGNDILIPMVTPYLPNPADSADGLVYTMPLAGLYYIPHKKFDDDRGFYSELNRIPEIERVTGQPFIIKQLNLSHSNANVIRGFHAEAWDKLLSVIQGIAFCAWADIRPESPTFGQVVTMKIGIPTPEHSDAQFGSVFVSNGFANSFCVLSEKLDYLYAVNALYAERDTSKDVALSLFDPDLNVPWPIPQEELVISKRDRQSITLREKFPEKF